MREAQAMPGPAATALEARLERGEPVLLDGGIGTELEARGARMDDDAWSAVANVEAFELVQQVHIDYVAAGADVITTNTFSAGPLSLGAAGLAERADEIHRRAMEAARGARDAASRPIVIAGSMSGMGTGDAAMPSERELQPIRDGYRRLADNLASGGADLLLLEMMQLPDWHGVVLDAALETGLPVWVGVSAGAGRGDRIPTHSYASRDLEEALVAFLERPVDAVLVMHTDIQAVDDALDLVRRHWRGTLGVYPHHGGWAPPHWLFEELSVSEFVGMAARWLSSGARILGGCCGTRPEHIQALHDELVLPRRDGE
jgi:S-methylmethionine-dependent homocysteine/selenocysteine methylase